ncbi:hypothetical protein DFH09DRAFT_1205342 [Mycena vulgaris]|nr:hypothetical protein DFH09DRAFT_1205342 [Mycena vulgaris]
MPNPIYTQGAFHNVFRRLETLYISVMSGLTAPVEFWGTSIPHMVRSAGAHTSLTIRSDRAVGAYPAMSFKDTFLPQLTSLRLGYLMLQPLVPEYDVIAFIIVYKVTLTHPELRRCSIDGDTDKQFPRRWCTVFAIFEADLECLQTFVFATEPDRDEHAVALRVHNQRDLACWRG